ncbi:MAG: hypothetical protein JW811_06350 [Clostridiales bacterium]|nr:hypothetical protein [Clostridiales bacterium]
MNHRERVHAVLHYRPYDRMPLVSFGYWPETLTKWAAQGHIEAEDAEGYRRDGDNAPADRRVMRKLGFDFNWCSTVGGNSYLMPPFKEETLETKPDGSRIIRNAEGLIEKVNDAIVSIPAMVGTSLTGREAWEELYLPRLTFSPDRVDAETFRALAAESGQRLLPLGLQVGSLYGNIRNILGVEELSYLAVDDEVLYREIIDTIGNLCYQVAEAVLAFGVAFDYAHYWEDICFKNGPLINPAVFRELVAPHYARIGKLLLCHGIDITSVDCDGCVDLLVPVWLESGVNTMFPIEVGTWNASVAPWRKCYGKELRGVGGMDKRVFAQDRSAVDAEIERLKPLVDLGGYIPCPDHRIPPDAEFGVTAYYCEAFRKAFG